MDALPAVSNFSDPSRNSHAANTPCDFHRVSPRGELIPLGRFIPDSPRERNDPPLPSFDFSEPNFPVALVETGQSMSSAHSTGAMHGMLEWESFGNHEESVLNDQWWNESNQNYPLASPPKIEYPPSLWEGETATDVADHARAIAEHENIARNPNSTSVDALGLVPSSAIADVATSSNAIQGLINHAQESTPPRYESCTDSTFESPITDLAEADAPEGSRDSGFRSPHESTVTPRPTKVPRTTTVETGCAHAHIIDVESGAESHEIPQGTGWEDESTQAIAGVEDVNDEHASTEHVFTDITTRLHDVEYYVQEMWNSWPHGQLQSLDQHVNYLEESRNNHVQAMAITNTSMARITSNIAQQNKRSEECETIVTHLHDVVLEVRDSVRSQEQRVANIEQVLAETKEAISSEVKKRESDIQAVGEILRRDREAQASHASPHQSTSTMVMRDSEVEIHLRQLNARMEQLEQLQHSTQTSQVASIDRAIASVMQLMEEKMEQKVAPLHEEIRRLKHQRTEELKKVERYIQQYVAANAQHTTAMLHKQREQDLSEVRTMVQHMEHMLNQVKNDVQQRDSTAKTTSHNDITALHQQLDGVRSRASHCEGIFRNAIQDLQRQLRELQLQISKIAERPTITSANNSTLEMEIRKLAIQVGNLQLGTSGANSSSSPLGATVPNTSVKSVAEVTPGHYLGSSQQQTVSTPSKASEVQVRPELRLARSVKQVHAPTVALGTLPLQVPTQSTSYTSAPQPHGNPTRGVEVRIAPVGVQPTTPALQFLPPQLMESVMGRHPGRFSGNAEDWPQWRRKWIPFLRELEGMWPTVTDTQRLALLRSSLDEAGALLIDQVLEANPDVSYE